MKKTLRIASYGRCAEDVKNGPRMIYLRADLGCFYREERNESLITYDDKYDYADAEIFSKTIGEILEEFEKHSAVMVVLPKNCKKSFLNYFRSVKQINLFDVDATEKESVAYVASLGNYSIVVAPPKKRGFKRLLQILSQLLEELFPFGESPEAKELKRNINLLGNYEGSLVIKKVERVKEILVLITESPVLN